MQLIWLSGPTGKVVSFSVTRRGLLLAGAALSILLIVSGVVLHFIGLRLAVTYSPEVAQQLGGVTSQHEQARIEQTYRDELAALRQKMGQLVQRVGELEISRAQINELVGIRQARASHDMPSWLGRGGPLQRLSLSDLTPQTPPPLARELAQTLQHGAMLDQSWQLLHRQWAGDAQRLAQLPVGLPLAGPFLVSSAYGLRIDPIRGLPAHHEGMDFIAPTGTPVLATAPGVVTRSQWAGPYGQLVEIAHAENYTTRYAHLSQRLVQEGQQVDRGQPLGHLGSTGRSTGPHLHYEVEHRSRTLDPLKALAPLSWR